jgi:signal transduction histidine kinase
MTISSKLRYRLIQIAIILMGLSVGVWMALKEQKQINQQLVEFDQSLALSILPEDILALKGNTSDLENPAYGKIKSLLQQAKAIESQAQYVYLFGQLPDGEVFFYADNEDPENIEDYSPPGQIYSEATPEDKQIFIDAQSRTFVSSDRWGDWVTASAPIIDPETNKVLGTVNVDMPQRIYYSHMATAGAVPLLISLIFALSLFVYNKISAAQEKLLFQRAEYLAVTAHDLKTPLNGIEWLVQTMEKSISNNPELVKNLQKIQTASKDMLVSIDDVVNASSTHLGKVATGSRQAVDLNGLTQKVLGNLSLSVQQQELQIKTEFGPNALVLADSDALRRAIGNLLSNSIKYSKPGGSIEIGSARQGEKIMWQITDHGVGIPAAEQKKVLTGYYRASNVKEQGIPGSGLGLFYTKKVVEAHGGQLVLHSTVSQGTTIACLFPAASSN